jgi:hypothetical protein
LKDPVKDELVRSGKPNTLTSIITKAIEIDNRFYKRLLEKKGYYRVDKQQDNCPYKTTYKQPFNRQQNAYNPIELDTTLRKELSL